MTYVPTLKYGINVQVVINIQVGNFLQKNKHTGLNKRTGGSLELKDLTLHGALLVISTNSPGYKYFEVL